MTFSLVNNSIRFLFYPHDLHKNHLLFLDADGDEENISGKKGKSIYEGLLLKALPYLRKDSLVLAHDVRWAKLSGEINGYLSLVRNPSLFSYSTEVCFDIQGLEISKKSG